MEEEEELGKISVPFFGGWEEAEGKNIVIEGLS